MPALARPGRDRVAALVAVLVVLPLLRLAQVVWQETDGDLPRILGSAVPGMAVRNTVVLAVAVTLAAVPIGVVMALVLRRPDLPGRAFWRVAVLVPLLVPDFVLGYSWTQAYARAGFTDSALGLHGPGCWARPGSGWSSSSTPRPWPTSSSPRGSPRGPNRTWNAPPGCPARARHIADGHAPLPLPSVAAASVLIFVLTLGTFAIPQVLGAPAGFNTVTTPIYADLSLGGDPASFLEAVALALLLVLVTAACVAPADAFPGPGCGSPARPTPRPDGCRPAGRACAVRRPPCWPATFLTMALPLAALSLSSVTRALGVPPTPANWSLDHFRQVLTPRTVEALGRSVGLAVVAASLLVLLGGLVAVSERRRAGRTRPRWSRSRWSCPGRRSRWPCSSPTAAGCRAR